MHVFLQLSLFRFSSLLFSGRLDNLLMLAKDDLSLIPVFLELKPWEIDEGIE